MSRSHSTLSNRLLDTFAVAFAALVGRLPLAVASWIGGALGRLAGVVGLRKRGIITKNLELAGVQSPNREYWRSWSSAGKTYLESLWCTQQQPHEILRHVAVEDLDVVHAAAAEGKGILLVSCHFGNWELIPAVVGCAGLPVAVVARRLRTSGLEEQIVGFRARCGVRTLMRGEPGASVAGYRLMARGGVLGCMMDRMSGGRRVLVPFLGFGMHVPLGPPELCLRSGSPIILGMAYRGRRGSARITFRRIEWDDVGDASELATRIANALDEAVRTRPADWYWILRRHQTWKGDAIPLGTGKGKPMEAQAG